MNRMSLTTPVLACLLTLSVVQAAPRIDTRSVRMQSAVTLRDQTLRSNVAWPLLESLTTEVGSRAAGTPGDRAAVAWAVAKLRQLGFSNVRTQEVIVPQWVRGEAEFSILAPHPQTMPVLALGGSAGTPDTGLSAEIVMARDVPALLAMPREQVEGRIVFLNTRMERTRDGSGYGKAVRSRSEGPSAAASLGAIGLVIRSISTSQNRLPHTGTLSYNIQQPRIPALALSNPDADAIERMLAAGQQVRVFMRNTSRDLPQTRSANVIGELPGTDPDPEIVLLGAHLDSWDPGTGAQDDGAGVAIVVGAVKAVMDAGLKPRRTLRVVLFANEEFGLSGATKYAQLETERLARHALAMEADTGAGPVYRVDTLLPEQRLGLGAEILHVVKSLGVEAGGNQASGGADLRPLKTAGVPILDLELDATYYFDVHHTANDTLNQVDPKKLTQSTAVHAVAAWLAGSEPSATKPAAPQPPPAR
jgi:hypothetical protein